jgi:hypothetical protein
LVSTALERFTPPVAAISLALGAAANIHSATVTGASAAKAGEFGITVTNSIIADNNNAICFFITFVVNVILFPPYNNNHSLY